VMTEFTCDTIRDPGTRFPREAIDYS